MSTDHEPRSTGCNAVADVADVADLFVRALVRLVDGLNAMREPIEPEKNPHAVELGKLGGAVGGPARAAKLPPEERSRIARKAALERWRSRSDATDPPVLSDDARRQLTERTAPPANIDPDRLIRHDAAYLAERCDAANARLREAHEAIRAAVDAHSAGSEPDWLALEAVLYEGVWDDEEDDDA